MSTDIYPASFRARCSLLRYYPLHHVDVLKRFEDQISDISRYRVLALKVEDYELKLANDSSGEAMLVRAMLKDPQAAEYLSSLSSGIQERNNDIIAAHLCQYRILDFELSCCGAPNGPNFSPPRVLQKIDPKPFKRPQISLFNKLSNWRGIVQKFVTLVNTAHIVPQPVVMEPDHRFSLSMSHLQCLSDGFASANLNVIAQNFRGAAMHLSLLLESTFQPNALPDIPTSESEASSLELAIPSHKMEKFDDNTRQKICEFVTAHKPADLRRPLHMSLLLTMLVLIIPVNLLKTDFPRSSIPILSTAIGNQQPSILYEIEKEIWTALLKISENSTKEALDVAFKALIESGPFRAALDLLKTDPVFRYFDPDYVCNETDISPLPQSSSDMGGSSQSVRPHAEYVPPLGEGPTRSQSGEHVVTQSDSMPPQVADHVPPLITECSPSPPDERGPPPPPADGFSPGNTDVHMDFPIESLHGDGEQRQGTLLGDAQEPMCVDLPRTQVAPDDTDSEGEEDSYAGGMRRSVRIAGTKNVIASGPVAPLSRSKRSKKSSSINESKNNGNETLGPPIPGPTAWAQLEGHVFVEAPEPITISDGQAALPQVKTYESEEPFIAYTPDGTKFPFSVITHEMKTALLLESLYELVEDGYQDDMPLHIVNLHDDDDNESASRQKSSVFKIITQDDFNALNDLDVQNLLREMHIVVTNRQLPAETFRTALQRLAPLQRIIEYQDHSLPSDSNRLRTGKVIDLLHAAESEDSKILNALQFPNPLAGVEPTSFSSDAHALSRVIGQEGWCKYPIPVEHICWGTASNRGAFHPWHFDSDGFGTVIDILVGAKWWIVARPIDNLAMDTFYNTSLLIDDRFDLDKSGKGLFAAEAILLTPGSRLIMKPNTLHAVYSPMDSVCRGGHYYATSTMKDTFVGLVHTFVCDKYITNTSHPPSRFILAELVNFFHAGLVRLDEFDSTDSSRAHILSDPSCAHIPDPSTPAGFMDLLIVCGLGTLSNVLSFQTYLAPGPNGQAPMNESQSQLWSNNDENALPEEDRKLCCLARGQALEIVAWLDAKYRICHHNIHSPQKLFSSMLVAMCKMIHHYKWQADANEVVHNPNFTFERLCVQMNALLSMPIIKCDDDLDLDAMMWEVPLHADAGCPMLPDMIEDCHLELIPNAQYTSLSLTDLFKSGETVLDQIYAQGFNVKYEQVDETVPIDTNSPPRKRRKHNT